jgi:hypothetical protein
MVTELKISAKAQNPPVVEDGSSQEKLSRMADITQQMKPLELHINVNVKTYLCHRSYERTCKT